MSSFVLHIIAMIFMLCDHMWATIIPNNNWLTCIGRIAFPIFAFMIVEGYFHTKDLNKYLKRLFVCAIISEIPFNLMYSVSLIYPFHQNVIWTFIIGLICISFIDKVRKKDDNKLLSKIFYCSGISILGVICGYLLISDYYGLGVLTVIIFYFAHGKNWYNYAIQIIGLWIINVVLLKGYYYDVSILGMQIELQQQALAMFSLPIIWLYNGKQGVHNKYTQYIFYLFYPVHMLILYLLMFYTSNF